MAVTLNAYRSFIIEQVKLFNAALPVTDKTVRRDKFREHEVSPEHLADISERRICDILHGSKKERLLS
jgi:hypothetical protein